MEDSALRQKKVVIPVTLSLLLALVYVVLRLFGRRLMDETGFDWLLTAVIISTGVAIVRIISYVIFDIIFQKRKGREAPALLRMVISIIGYAALFVVVYTFVFQRDLSGVLATSAVLTVIIGLALQDTLGNFFAGLSLHIEQPYYIGDAIQLGDMLGKVESVTWRTTTIRTNDNSLIIFPNNKIARESLEIHPLQSLNRRVLAFPAPYSAPPQQIISLVREAVRTLPRVSPEKTPVVRIREFSDSSITYEILYWVADYMWTPNMDAQIRERIWYLYSRNGLDIPFPIRHVLFEQREPSAQIQEIDLARVIDSVEIFEPLTREEREKVIASLARYVYAPGEEILRRGAAGDSMFVIRRGKAEVQAPAANGKPQRVAVLEAGDFFGEMALFTGEPRTADVQALEEVEVFEIKKSAIEQLFCDNEKLAEAFSRKIAERQARLAEYSRAVPASEVSIQSETILKRIKRFFKLG
ncbi:MAG: mechanosensitive ion channel family protein [Blastocatellia bacterium]|nr:mechanosensitive ion channel family protein [Blastocatellia bacterium]